MGHVRLTFGSTQIRVILKHSQKTLGDLALAARPRKTKLYKNKKENINQINLKYLSDKPTRP